MTKIVPVILSGGSGSRLWPLSRALYPKQFFNLVSDQRSMLQETAQRAADPALFGAPLVVCNIEHRFIIAEHLREIDVAPRRIVLEPVGRNTAAAVATAALAATATDPDAVILIMPADAAIRDLAAFQAACSAALHHANTGRFVTFGITPTHPETGYGYIRVGATLAGPGAACAIDRFVEKPDRATAEGLLAQGGHLWNSGMLLLPAARLLAEMDEYAPAVIAAIRRAWAKAEVERDFLWLDRDSFGECPNLSIDQAVMERTRNGAVVPVDMGWSDVGSWDALWQISSKDAGGNARVGDVVFENAQNCYARSDFGLTVLVGVKDLVVVASDDTVMVADRNQAQQIKAVVDRLRAAGRDEVVTHKKVYRPWGFYQQLHNGQRFQVKRLTVNPGGKLSLQKHFHRAEHWIVVNGTAQVTRNDEQILLTENESIYLPIGSSHRLENPGRVPLTLIEVQSGAYLGEDDIVRMEDYYGRDSRPVSTG